MNSSSIRRRLWFGFAINLFFLPTVYAILMFTSIGQANALFADMVKLGHLRHQAAELQVSLFRSSSGGALTAAVGHEPGALEQISELQQGAADLKLEGDVPSLLRELRTLKGEAAAARASALGSALIEALDKAHKHLAEIQNQTVTTFSILIPIAFALVIGASFLVARRILGPLEALASAARTMAGGDLRHRVEVPADRELKSLAEGFNLLRDRLAQVLGQLQTHSREVATTTSSVTTATTQMADGAHEQSAATEETSTALEEIAAQIQSVSKNAVDLADDTSGATSVARQIGTTAEGLLRSAQELDAAVQRASQSVEEVSDTARTGSQDLKEVAHAAQEINHQAADGGAALQTTIDQIQSIGETIRQSNQTIQQLNQRSRQITSIVEAMAEIADQTNLLALNAAIEAARAGDSGRGFAVVADEVRKLAERAVSSAKEVAQLVGAVREELGSALVSVEQNTQRTGEGIKLLTDTGGKVRRMVESIQRVSSLVSRVSGAVEDQSGAAQSLRQEIDKVRSLSSSLYQTAATQAQGATSVVSAFERMNVRTRQVADATVQIRTGGEQVLRAVENISVVARQNQEAVQRVSSAMQSLSTRVGTLQSQVSTIRVDGDNR